MAYQDANGRRNYPPEPSIKDTETWLHLQAHQMDIPYWWAELTAIPRVEDPKRLAQKICASFSIPAVRCEAFPGQRYTVPPAPKCITRNLFLPDDLSNQDIQQQPFLLTMAYTQGLQYWAEKFNPPANLDFHPLARSVLELMGSVKEHNVFSKWDIVWGLGRIDPGTTNWWPQPTITGIGSMQSNSAGVWETCGTIPSLFEPPPERGDTTVLSTKPKMEDWATGQDTSPIEATTQPASATPSVVELTSPIIPPDWMEEERWYMLVVTTSMRSLNLETTRVILGTWWLPQPEEWPSRIPIWQQFSPDPFEREGWLVTRVPL